MKKILFALILISFFIGCGGTTGNVIVKTKVQGNVLSNINLQYRNPANNSAVMVKNGVVVNCDADDYQTFYVNLQNTSSKDHIKLISDMNNGLKAYLVFLNAADKSEVIRQEIPKNGIDGYTKEDVVSYEYDRRGKQVGQKQVKQGIKVAYGDKTYENTSQIPVDIDFNKLPNKETNLLVFLELAYDEYEQPQDENTTEVTSEELQNNENQIEVVHNVNYREVYFKTPRKTKRYKIKVIKKSGSIKKKAKPTKIESGSTNEAPVEEPSETDDELDLDL